MAEQLNEPFGEDAVAAAHDEAHQHSGETCLTLDESMLDDIMPDEEILYDLADLFKIFSDTSRIKILYVLIDHEMRVGDIADAVGASQSAVSHQLRILKNHRLVKFKRDGKNVLYSLADDHVHDILSRGMDHICE